LSQSIPLSSFAPHQISSAHLLDGEDITILPHTLCRYLEIAESRSFAEEEGLEDSPPSSPKTPTLENTAEQLNSEGEALFLVRKEDSANRAIPDDSSFKAQRDAHALDERSKQRFQKLANAAQGSFAECALLRDENQPLFKQNGEAKRRR
jgi:hypothetical protein